MAETKKPSLTVLGGPMAGTRFVFEDASEDITVGSDEGCSFRLELPGVSPNHARIVVEGGALFIHDADSGTGLHVNDNRVGEGGAALRNGDIVWLGTPGDAEVVMLQCILPRLSPASPAPAAPPPAPTPAPEDETATLALEADTLFGAETVIQPAPPPVEPEVTLGREFVEAQEPAESPEPVTFAMDDEATQMLPPAAPRFEDAVDQSVMEAAFVVSEESSTVVLDSAEVTGEMPEPTVVLPAEPEVTLAMPPPEPTRSVPMPPPIKPLPVKPPAPIRPLPPPASRVSTGATTRPLSRPAPSPRPRPQPAERATPADRAAPADRSTPPPPRAPGGSSTGLYAGIGIAALLILSAGGYAAWRFLSKKPGPPVAQSSRAPTTLPSASAPLVTQATPHPIATPESRPVEPPTPAAVVATPTPKASAAPAASPSPSPSPKKGSPTPPPVTGPSAEALHAQQVASLLGQAEAALGSSQYDQAIVHFDEVLRLDPQNAKALADKATAVSLRDAARKRFVPGRTAVKTEKASGGLAGFDSGDVAVQKAPDFLGRIEFEMNPAGGIKPGDPYTLRFFLVNEGKKAIRIQGITLSTMVNGIGTGAPVSAAAKEVAPQQRAPLGEVSGSWKDGTTAWSAEVLVTANKGDSLKNQMTWR